ncbi:hypothetical protein [Virgisporangium aurantiacum]|uniref:Uncharacterized protein n=1 Tax=Virgisporangium aurantiacum TaxID=175570 RepID=A0A8J3ZFM4_9ACTN|nr:hypothetical protein [Virgisporangium aurantiacum]GIJ63059.1 hypothetical protein Vau01_105750 [Virgisporangium aurantiacum]
MTVEPHSTDARGDRPDERGVVLTAAGREQARRQLDEAAARWTDEERRDRAASALDRLRSHAA